MQAHARVMPAEDVLMLLESLLEGRRAAFKRRCTIAFAVVDAGPYFLDTAATAMVERVWRTDADVSVLCNQRTLSDLVAGRFDVARPAPEHLFVWGGDRGVWEAFAKAFSGSTNALGARLAQLQSLGPKLDTKPDTKPDTRKDEP